ncbi:hypothetical protein TorRG33x02_169180, partial [Trema orientale]
DKKILIFFGFQISFKCCIYLSNFWFRIWFSLTLSLSLRLTFTLLWRFVIKITSSSIVSIFATMLALHVGFKKRISQRKIGPGIFKNFLKIIDYMSA